MIAPIAVAAFAFALSFGVLARTAGMGWVAPLVMSATTFAGSAQFAVASVLDERGLGGGCDRRGGNAERALRADRDLDRLVVRRSAAATARSQSQLVVDESWAVTLRRKGGFDVRVLVGAGVLLYVCWNVGTVIGLLLGNVIGDPNRLGLDAAFAALFLALLIPQLRSRRKLVGGPARRRDLLSF